jgi:hypothetical protein
MMLPAFAPCIAVAVTFFAGLAFGSGYFAVLRRTIDLYSTGHRRLLPAILTLGRFAAAILFLAATASSGALPALASFAGFLAARAVALRALRRAT